MRVSVVAACVLLSLSCVADGVWRNLDAEHYVSGRKASEGYLRGKVILVCKDPERAERMEEIWNSFKTKPFVLLGSYGQRPIATTFPVYDDAGLIEKEPRSPLYVVDACGKVCFMGQGENTATLQLVTALTDLDAPKNSVELRKFLDYELANLPGRAYMRMEEFKKRFPQDAKAYAEKEKALKSIPDIKKLAELIAFSKKAKDMRIFDAKSQGKKAKFEKMLAEAIKKYAPLKDIRHPLAAQEAKNALADLKWTQAAL